MDHSIKQAFIIYDAAGHGEDSNGFKSYFGVDYLNGSPKGSKIYEQMKTFPEKKINFTIEKVNDSCDAMIQTMQANYNSRNRSLNVSYLAYAVLTKTSAGFWKEFDNVASLMLISPSAAKEKWRY